MYQHRLVSYSVTQASSPPHHTFHHFHHRTPLIVDCRDLPFPRPLEKSPASNEAPRRKSLQPFRNVLERCRNHLTLLHTHTHKKKKKKFNACNAASSQGFLLCLQSQNIPKWRPIPWSASLPAPGRPWSSLILGLPRHGSRSQSQSQSQSPRKFPTYIIQPPPLSSVMCRYLPYNYYTRYTSSTYVCT